MSALTGGSLCSGSGGLDLGLERTLGIEWLWHCEKDAAASQILAARWPGVPNHGDLFETDWSVVERVDIVTAGFPCPDYSLAGRRAGIDGEHGQVWFAVAAALRALRPRLVVLENVDAIRTAPGPVGGDAGESAVGVVLADLADLGYRWAYDRIRAADVGAPHGRLRWFCVAALPSPADPVGGGVDADGGVPRRGARALGPGGPASPVVAPGPEVDGAEDALADDPDAAADGEVGVGGSAPADAERGRREQHDEGERRVPVASEGSAPARLLPTPTAGDGDASGSRNLEGSAAHAGVSLTDAVQTGGSTEPRLLPTPTASEANDGPSNVPGLRDGGASLRESVRLLPTPQAADGDGGRQEKGAMANAGQRPSGQKATLPLPTAVQMRDELGETPFAKPDEGEEQLVLLPTPTGYVGDSLDRQLPTEIAMLPTPVANPENPGSGGELRAAIVHGEGRRNETGVDTLGRTNEGRPSKLLPTPTTQDAANTAGDSQRERHSDPLNVVAADLAEPQLLPTPRATSERNSRKAMVENDQWSSVSLAQATEIAAGILPREFKSWDEVPGELGRDARARIAAGTLLPTPQEADGDRSSEQFQRHYADGADNPTLLGAARRAEVEWGVYEAAVRRWEHVLERAAPAPTDEKGRLDPPFVEWMLGYPAGWFDVDGVSRTRKLRALGNSVQVQCAEAVGGWLAFLLESGLLLDEPAPTVRP